MRAMAETLRADSFDTFGTLLRFLRRRAGLKQRELAARVGYSEAHISRLEGGQRRDPRRPGKGSSRREGTPGRTALNRNS